ncbi:hypothetical protein CXF68_17870 [Tenacibaculum sp. Bg11-29]|uniref:hypothetical protein n=1 Tax=Tenacibaculum sp. Bg11-29 TaxID=2058306 RepID=UPI000C336F96|nr:hypothetical protein [Tenacibaculum sp. Bg11-29]PKH52445.1 hypothetical protein CXF68_17870 [Tenacibaculum sp. Bg11-29]
MIERNKILLILLIAFFTFVKSFGQQTPKQFSEQFLKIISSKDTIEMKRIVPNIETLTEFSKSIGIEKNENEISEISKEYHSLLESYYNGIALLRENGKMLGINWNFIKLKKVEVKSIEQKIEKDNKSITLTKFNIKIISKNNFYTIYINHLFEYKGKWYYAGNNPQIEKH